ncbi:protein late bloomer-like [Drosophila persimilis]|uniref:protein late bloomer-like n=1 Tax=Drosophila persimilis TaxID=7234 RepID=UPI000F095356|nr:protein late bloomer-like [Drosophila persimilis]
MPWYSGFECLPRHYYWACIIINIVIVIIYLEDARENIYIIQSIPVKFSYLPCLVIMVFLQLLSLILLITDGIMVYKVKFNATQLWLGILIVVGIAPLVLGSYLFHDLYDIYAVVYMFRTNQLGDTEQMYKCCGMLGPVDYNYPRIPCPESCYHNKTVAPENIYERGCLGAMFPGWIIFVLCNAYNYTFILIILTMYLHFRLKSLYELIRVDVERGTVSRRSFWV